MKLIPDDDDELVFFPFMCVYMVSLSLHLSPHENWQHLLSPCTRLSIHLSLFLASYVLARLSSCSGERCDHEFIANCRGIEAIVAS